MRTCEGEGDRLRSHPLTPALSPSGRGGKVCALAHQLAPPSEKLDKVHEHGLQPIPPSPLGGKTQTRCSGDSSIRCSISSSRFSLSSPESARPCASPHPVATRLSCASVCICAGVAHAERT